MSTLLMFSVAAALSTPLPTQSTSYVKGDVVRLETPADSDPLPDVRVIAVSGDRIQADRSGILVNSERVADVSPQLLEQFAETWDQIVPAGHYFVIAERVGASSAVRYHGLIPAAKIVKKVGK
jgi:signal peptidase I